ncbi:MAG: 3-hydroxyacyl-[acyl-carrier-protein] dehydratase FabZ [Candidatus Anoxychlamydiales bacterium]|nr:3-hydroxyacyl-[acyl-carrier-protein] dehydratase FabZ [Candidatus Anoxychlamydiales bacterium]
MNNKTVIDHREIAKILPHGYPFLLVDRVVHIDLDNNEIIGQKNVTVNEEFFQGHFPDAPIMPGVLVIEAMAQTGGILVYQKGHIDKIAVLLKVSSAKFRRPIYPGDVIFIHAKAIHISSKGGKMKAKALVDEKVCVEAELSFALVAKEKL